jgi:hypothetical protein
LLLVLVTLVAVEARLRITVPEFASKLYTQATANTGTPASVPITTPDPNTLAAGNVQFNAASYTANEGDGSAKIFVSRTGDSSEAASVDFATSDGTAKQRTRYTIAKGTLTFNPGVTSKSFNVLLVDSAYVDGNQSLNLTLSNPQGCTLGSPNPVTLTIIDNDTVAPVNNPLDNLDAKFFVTQHYYDFLSRVPDPDGFAYWSSQITQCGADQTCIRNKRVDVSNAFFFEAEYQQTAAYVFRLYRAAYGNNQPFPNPDSANPAEAKKIPSYSVFSTDRARLVGSSHLAQDQLELANLFAARTEFTNRYPASLSLIQFVDALLLAIKNDSGVDLTSQRNSLIGLGSRGSVIYRLADDAAQTNPINNGAFIDAEYNRAFVASQYFGYLRRDADIGGFLFWLGQVNGCAIRNTDVQHDMVCSFLTSAEYQQRFSPFVTHFNSECTQSGACFGSVTLRTFEFSDSAAGGKGPAAGGGAVISLDGKTLGTTGPDGSVTVMVPVGSKTIDVLRYPSSSATVKLNVIGGSAQQVDVVLQDGKDLAFDAELKIDQIVNGVLSSSFSALMLRFTNSQGAVSIASVDQIELLRADGSTPKSIATMFTLSGNGTLSATDITGLRSALNLEGAPIQLHVHGEDALGRPLDGVNTFYLGRFQITGRLAPPPSNVSLNTSGILVTAKVLNTPIVYYVVSDASGNFSIASVPTGNIEFACETLQNGKYYYGKGVAVLSSNISITLNMLNSVDLANGVLQFTVSQTSAPAEESTLARSETQDYAPPALPFPETVDGSVSVAVTAGAQNVSVSKTATLTIPKGTASITLSYSVATAEYPQYVLAHSIYDDVWTLSLAAGSGGQQLYSISRQVNSQLTSEPLWQSNGSTGTIVKKVDVSSLTVNADTTVTMSASAMNVGDSQLATSVNATVGTDDAQLKINSITHDKVGFPFGVASGISTNGNSTYYSIPRPGATNLYTRTFRINFTKPKGATITKVTVTLMAAADLMKVLDEGIGAAVRQVDDQNIDVQVTMNPTASTVVGQPPPTHNIKYRFKLTASNAGSTIQDEKTSEELHALWRMPDGLTRYGARDQGGDDWCSKGTYNWLSTNTSLVTAIDDISGEHARHIGHASHFYGTDIDMFHFYRFPNAVSGGDNYSKLRADTLLSIQTGSDGTAARQRVISWVNATRTGLDKLAAKAEVSQLLYAKGAATTGLSAGWARDLLQTGKITVSGQALNLGLASWTNSKYVPRSDHDDHLHVTLSRSVLGE